MATKASNLLPPDVSVENESDGNFNPAMFFLS
jgi:hypothetical protein